VCLCLCFARLSQFVVYQDGLKPSLPQIIIGILIMDSFFYMFGNVFFCQLTPIRQQVWLILFLLSWPLGWTACMLLGFYFREVSVLTSSQSGSNILGKLLIPALVVMGLVWVFFLTLEIFVAAGSPGVLQSFWPDVTGGVDAARFTFQQLETAEAAVFFVCMGVVIVVIVFGVVSLLFAVAGTTGQHRGSVLNIVVLGFILVVDVGAFGFFRWSQTFAFSGYGWGLTMTLSSNYMLRFVLIDNIYHPILIIVLLANFRVKTAKEIEISKSGTSSTSSGSSKSSSSSSSSSSTSDPVIEL